MQISVNASLPGTERANKLGGNPLALKEPGAPRPLPLSLQLPANSYRLELRGRSLEYFPGRDANRWLFSTNIYTPSQVISSESTRANLSTALPSPRSKGPVMPVRAPS